MFGEVASPAGSLSPTARSVLVIPPSGSVRLARYSLPTIGVLVDRVDGPCFFQVVDVDRNVDGVVNGAGVLLGCRWRPHCRLRTVIE